jgi:hypothetical protein
MLKRHSTIHLQHGGKVGRQRVAQGAAVAVDALLSITRGGRGLGVPTAEVLLEDGAKIFSLLLEALRHLQLQLYDLLPQVPQGRRVVTATSVMYDNAC